MTIIQILTFISVWCGNPSSVALECRISRDDGVTNECRAEFISCLEDAKVLPDTGNLKVARSKLLACAKMNNIR